MMKTKHLILLFLFGTVVSLDQVTKYLAVERLTTAFEQAGAKSFGERLKAFVTQKNLDNEPFEIGRVDARKPAVPVVAGYWSHKYVENPGAAWGLLSGVESRWRVPFFHVVSVAAILLIGWFFRKLEDDQLWMATAFSLVLGGAMGNYIDRMLRSYVIDFVDWHWRDQPGLHWPTFNVADSAICAGVVVMLLEAVFAKAPAGERQAIEAAGEAAQTILPPAGDPAGGPSGQGGDERI